MKFRKTNRRADRDVVASVEQQTLQATRLSDIAAQRLLADPRTNPATRGHADRLRNDQQRAGLEAEHARQLRRIRVDAGRADHAERALEAIRAAREAHSPARSVVELTQGRTRYGAAALGASLLLSVGSALGAEALAERFAAPTGVGYLAEVGMTGLATAVILYTGHLTAHGGTAEGWQRKTLIALMAVPLLASIVVSTAGSGPVGAACSVGAACFALLAYLVADRSSAAIQANAKNINDADEQQLHEAIEHSLFDPVEPERGQEHDTTWVSDADIAAWLGQDPPPEGGVTAAGPTPVNPGPADAAAAVPPPGSDLGQIEAEQDEYEPGRDDGGAATERVLPALEGRVAVRETNTQRVADYMAAHPGASIADIATGTRLSESTVKRARRALRSEEGQ